MQHDLIAKQVALYARKRKKLILSPQELRNFVIKNIYMYIELAIAILSQRFSIFLTVSCFLYYISKTRRKNIRCLPLIRSSSTNRWNFLLETKGKKKKEGEVVWNADLAVQIRLRRVKGKGSCSDQVPFPSKSMLF